MKLQILEINNIIFESCKNVKAKRTSNLPQSPHENLTCQGHHQPADDCTLRRKAVPVDVECHFIV